MRITFFALASAVSLAGCAADPSGTAAVHSHDRDRLQGPGLFGDLRWNIDPKGRWDPVKVSDEEEFKKWRAMEKNNPERLEFEEWRAWQKWKRENAK